MHKICPNCLKFWGLLSKKCIILKKLSSWYLLRGKLFITQLLKIKTGPTDNLHIDACVGNSSKLTNWLYIPGYIIELAGPYMGANSDSQITKQIIQEARDQGKNIASWLRPGDILIVDRGFYDVVELLRDMGVDVSCLLHF